MGNGQSRGSSDVHDNPEAPQAETGAEVGEEKLSRKSPSDTGNETAEAHSDEGNAGQNVPPQEEVNTSSVPAEEPEPREPQENSQEAGQPPSLPQSTSSDKPHESDIAKPPVAEPSSEKAEDATPQIPKEAAGEPDAEPGVVRLSPEGPSTAPEGPSTAPELQPTTKTLHCLAEIIVQTKPCEIRPCSPTKKNECLGECRSVEVLLITETVTEMVEGHSDQNTAPGTEQPKVQSSVEAEQRTAGIAGANSKSAESAGLPIGGTQEGRPAVDAQTTEGGQDQSTAEIPAETHSGSPVAQPAPEVPLPSNAVEPTDTKPINGVQNDEAVHPGEEHPAMATVHDPEAKALPDHLAEPSTDVPQDSDEAKKVSVEKTMDETGSGSETIEMTEVQANKLNEHPQAEGVSRTGVTPEAQETQPVAAAEVPTQPQGSSSTQKGSTEAPVHTRKPGPKFATTFYLCCSDCSIGDGESNAEQ